jgi:hypothetical protein
MQHVSEKPEWGVTTDVSRVTCMCHREQRW